MRWSNAARPRRCRVTVRLPSVIDLEDGVRKGLDGIGPGVVCPRASQGSFPRSMRTIALLTAGYLRAAEPADLLVLGDIYTVDGARSWQRVLAVTDGKIVYVGPETGSEPYRGESTGVITLEPGQMVMPGIQDSHVHLLDGELDQLKCDLINLKTPEQVTEDVN